MSRIREIPKEYSHITDMNLLMVHSSCFRTLMLVVKLVMNVCKPNVEIDWSTEQMEKLYNEPDVYEFVKHVIGLCNRREAEFQKIVGDFQKIIKTASLGQKRCNKFEDLEKQLNDRVDKLRIAHHVYSHKPLQLENVSEAVISEEEEGDIVS